MSEITRPERVQAAFEVWRQSPETGPNATAMFEYIEQLEAALSRPEAIGEPEPVAWVIPGDDNARPDGFIDAMAWREGEFTRPLYALPSEGEKRMREEMTEIRKSIRNAMGAIESNQVVDKDVHGTLKSVLARIDALSYQSRGNGEGRE